MAGQQPTLRRLAGLYETLEAVRSVDLQRATAMVVKVEQEIATQLAARYRALEEGRSALELGDDLGWRSIQAHAAMTERRCADLESVRLQRALLRDTARDLYRESRIESEQMGQILNDALRQDKVLQDRRAQNESDDRHLSRRRWRELQVRS
jgi:hypothetical protein